MKRIHFPCPPGLIGPRLLCLGLYFLLLAGWAGTGHSTTTQTGYFDPHNHLSGVLPWPAYADLPAYIRRLKGRGPGVTRDDKQRFYTWLGRTWYAKHRAAFDNQPFSSKLRFGLGARATLALYPPQPHMNLTRLNGALQRIFTATPFTEFDSAYAFHWPAYTWLTRTFYDGSLRAMKADLCTAQVLTLAHNGVTRSEQSISFIGGWNIDGNGHSWKRQTIRCAARKPHALRATLVRLGEPVPRIRILLMTHTDQLGQNAAGDAYQTFEGTGTCHWAPLPRGLKLSPQQMYDALLGRNRHRERIFSAGFDYFDTVAGIDTAGPEMTCFSAAGMTYYQRLVDAVYRAAKARRAMGWSGKLLVHTHVGEGFTTYYAPRPPAKPWTFNSVFSELPVLSGQVITNARAPKHNITRLLDAVAGVRQSHPDLDRYVVIRFGHLTHANRQQAFRMARLHVEADVNLDSNLATGAWSFPDMPAGAKNAQRAAKAAINPRNNFALNDLPHFLLPDSGDGAAVAGVFGTHPLKYLLEAHVRVMLGSDGYGVEHSSMAREHALAATLIRYWQSHDPAFKQTTGAISPQIFFDNARWHLDNMENDAPATYQGVSSRHP